MIVDTLKHDCDILGAPKYNEISVMRAILLVALFLLTQLTAAAPLKNLVVFGDSLSDTGNLYEYMHHQLPQSPPYFTGHFSDGPVWVEYLMKHYYADPSAHILDYAFGGAGILSPEDDDDDVFFTLRKEVDTYLLAHADVADPDNLYVVWIGGNNYLALPEDPESGTNLVIDGTKKEIDKLVKAGAKNVLLMNLPSLEKTPFANEFEMASGLKEISELHNQKLLALSQELEKTYPEVHWIHFDVNILFQDMLAHHQDYGFYNTTQTCYDSLATSDKRPSLLRMVANVQPKVRKEQAPCRTYFFFDLIHPTTRVHELMSEYLYERLTQEKITF